MAPPSGVAHKSQCQTYGGHLQRRPLTPPHTPSLKSLNLDCCSSGHDPFQIGGAQSHTTPKRSVIIKKRNALCIVCRVPLTCALKLVRLIRMRASAVFRDMLEILKCPQESTLSLASVMVGMRDTCASLRANLGILRASRCLAAGGKHRCTRAGAGTYGKS